MVRLINLPRSNREGRVTIRKATEHNKRKMEIEVPFRAKDLVSLINAYYGSLAERTHKKMEKAVRWRCERS
jgi:hypothetical protein